MTPNKSRVKSIRSEIFTLQGPIFEIGNHNRGEVNWGTCNIWTPLSRDSEKVWHTFINNVPKEFFLDNSVLLRLSYSSVTFSIHDKILSTGSCKWILILCLAKVRRIRKGPKKKLLENEKCSVCSEPATGFNFRVPSCNACKGDVHFITCQTLYNTQTSYSTSIYN